MNWTNEIQTDSPAFSVCSETKRSPESHFVDHNCDQKKIELVVNSKMLEIQSFGHVSFLINPSNSQDA